MTLSVNENSFDEFLLINLPFYINILRGQVFADMDLFYIQLCSGSPTFITYWLVIGLSLISVLFYLFSIRRCPNIGVLI